MKACQLFIHVVAFAAVFFCSCEEKKQPPEEKTIGEFLSGDTVVTYANMTTTTSSDTAKLGRLLSFKIYAPTHAKFRYTFIDNSGERDRSVPGPSDFQLEALMYFDSASFAGMMDFYRRADWVGPDCNKNEFNFSWLDTVVRKELLASPDLVKGYKDFFFTEPNSSRSHIWALDRKLLLHWSTMK